jgi:hypothetical protein
MGGWQKPKREYVFEGPKRFQGGGALTGRPKCSRLGSVCHLGPAKSLDDTFISPHGLEASPVRRAGFPSWGCQTQAVLCAL